jgi:hypothetical protein
MFEAVSPDMRYAWRSLRGLLFGVSPSDPRVFALTGIVLGTVSAVAGYLPVLPPVAVTRGNILVHDAGFPDDDAAGARVVASRPTIY